MNLYDLLHELEWSATINEDYGHNGVLRVACCPLCKSTRTALVGKPADSHKPGCELDKALKTMMSPEYFQGQTLQLVESCKGDSRLTRAWLEVFMFNTLSELGYNQKTYTDLSLHSGWGLPSGTEDAND